MARIGPRHPVLAGLALLTCGGTVLAGTVFAGTVFAEGAYHWLALGLLLTGFGIAYVLPALVAAVISAAPDGTAGAAGGLLNAVRQVGATLGVAGMGAAAAANTVWALMLSAGACALAGIVFASTHPTYSP
ncbi:hypothetical protein [Streptomyces sp. NPDC059894]|uniref:hypothetical protein n=1 Tax=unclassified Streptomyces TaxID=2593676 RepID=UPI003650CAD3